MAVGIHRYGERALLVDLPSVPVAGIVPAATSVPKPATKSAVSPSSADLGMTPAAFANAARVHFGSVLEEAVPAEETVLLVFRARGDASSAIAQLCELTTGGLPQHNATLIDIPVEYNGPDLESSAVAAGLSPADLITLHTSAAFRVAFFGFAPGFAYLAGLPPALHLPRRATPRTKVPAGAVAIAAHYSAIYPQESPGGWHLIGRTDAVLFDPRKAQPSLLEPGSQVRFHAI